VPLLVGWEGMPPSFRGMEGGAEFAGSENDGPKRSKTGKCRTWKMTGRNAGR